jgi:hypothetical protein
VVNLAVARQPHTQEKHSHLDCDSRLRLRVTDQNSIITNVVTVLTNFAIVVLVNTNSQCTITIKV